MTESNQRLSFSMRLLAPVVVSALVATGCLPVNQLKLQNGYAGYQTNHPERAKATKTTASTSIVVNLVAPDAAGCVLVQAEEEKRKYLKCLLSDLDGEHFQDELHAMHKAMPNKTPEGTKTNTSFVMLQYGDVLKQMLEKRLGEHFGSVTVHRVQEAPTTPSATGALTVTAKGALHQSLARGNDKTQYVILEATYPTGERVTADQHVTSRMGNGYLGWAIPVTLLSLPVGWAIALGAITGKETRMVERMVAESMDQAAKDLALQLATQSIMVPAAKQTRVDHATTRQVATITAPRESIR
ncbi:MAG: hypothetical protein ACPG4T_09595 [Nannocystaceae bacterium]